jgi:hypothetical protein
MGTTRLRWALALAVTACGPAHRAEFAADEGSPDVQQFAEPDACWRAPLTTRIEGHRIFVDDDWVVSNWRAGRWARETPRFSPVGGETPFDWKPDRERLSLALQHRRTGATVTLISMEAGVTNAELALDVILARRIDALRGSWSAWAAIGEPFVATGVNLERRFAVRQSAFETLTVGGEPAVAATLDLIDLDHREIEPDAVMRRLRMVVTRGRFNEDVHRSADADDDPRRSLLVATLSAPAAAFEQHLPDFGALLGKVVFEKGDAADERFLGCKLRAGDRD